MLAASVASALRFPMSEVTCVADCQLLAQGCPELTPIEMISKSVWSAHNTQNCEELRSALQSNVIQNFRISRNKSVNLFS